MDKQYTILIVDDTEINRSLLSDMLASQYTIREASNGMEAVALLDKFHSEIALVLLDIMMPVMDGFEVLSIMKRSGWIDSIPVITISAETSSNYIDQAYDLGATDYISRPFDEKTVQRRVKNTIILYAKQKMLEGMVAEQILEKEKSNYLMVEILSNIVEFRNGESGLHVLHIRTITELLLRRLVQMTDRYAMTPSQIALIVNASALHDIGKISIPEDILNKAGRLTAAEFDIMKTHSAIGAQILENAPNHKNEKMMQIAHDICRWHHERYDGLGYPDGLKGEEIPIAAQVVALADVYDALTNVRVYKPAYPHDTAMKMIMDGECGAFNPLLLQCLAEVGPHLLDKLTEHSENQLFQTETQNLTNQLLAGGQVSSRTLALLEQERVKYQFFASMSKEIQFEYNEHTEILSLSEWGANQLGLPELIVHPLENEVLHQVISAEDYLDLHQRLRQATPANPVVNRTYLLQVHGQERRFKVVARPLWVGEEVTEMTGTIGKLLDIHDELEELDTFRRLAVQDSLTKLHNHMAAREMIEAVLDSAKGKTHTMLLFDLDDFKSANDRYGHLFGDEVLKYVASKVLDSISSQDIAARMGGDEFLIFSAVEEGIGPMVDHYYQALTDCYRGFTISLSMGIAFFPQDGADYETLFRSADQALYAAKKNGKQQYRFYNASMQEYLSVLSPMDHELDSDSADGGHLNKTV